VLSPRLRLITLSFLQLFAQLALIRWLGARVVYMSFFSNFVLLASFLGFGLGFLWTGVRKLNLFPFAPFLLGALVTLVAVFDVPLDVTTTDIVFMETAEPDSVLPMWAVLLVLFILLHAHKGHDFTWGHVKVSYFVSICFWQPFIVENEIFGLLQVIA
jgi:hypothetical protein